MPFDEVLDDLKPHLPPDMFGDITAFHEKFKLQQTADGNKLPDDFQIFRAKFLLEELNEYLEAVGLCLMPVSQTEFECDIYRDRDRDQFNAEKAFDALIDLVYVAIGTAYLHRFPFNEGWRRVQAANMAKIRTQRSADSKRGSGWDVVKPPGWKAPDLSDLVQGVSARPPCPTCNDRGTVSRGGGCMGYDDEPCPQCKGGNL